jgi:hypothetical protein
MNRSCGLKVKRMLATALKKLIQYAWEEARCPEFPVSIDIICTAWFRIFWEESWWFRLYNVFLS